MPSLNVELIQAIVLLVAAGGGVYGVIAYGRSKAAERSEDAWKSVAEARDESLKDVGKRLTLAEQRAETLTAEILRLEQRPDLSDLLKEIAELKGLISDLKGAVDAIAERWG